MDDEQRDKIKKANSRRLSHLCTNCGAKWEKVDGSKCGGMPGIAYRHCSACGHSRAITKRGK